MRCSRVLFALVFGLGVAGCGEAATDGPGDSDGPDAGQGSDPEPGSGGTLTGHVTRSAAPAAGGRGDLYIGVFTSDPVADQEAAESVANLLLEDVDMSAEGVMVPYAIGEIPPRPEPYYVTAFLDDNGSVTDPANAGPDRGDLVAIEGLSSPQVTVSSETSVELDIDLNFNLPF